MLAFTITHIKLNSSESHLIVEDNLPYPIGFTLKQLFVLQVRDSTLDQSKPHFYL